MQAGAVYHLVYVPKYSEQMSDVSACTYTQQDYASVWKADFNVMHRSSCEFKHVTIMPT